MAQQLQPQSPMMIGADPQPLFAGNMISTQPPVTRVDYVPIKHTKDRHVGEKVRIAFYMTCLFVLFSFHGSYRAANTLYHAFTSKPFEMMSEEGAPTMKGLVIFAVIFFVVSMMLLMNH
jgi:hypothetical protein